MPKDRYKFHKSIYFEDKNSNKLFLFQLVNLGKTTDELKFTFNYPKAGTGIVYSETSSFTDPTGIQGLSGEITYHSDGAFLHKFPNQTAEGSPMYKNPFGIGKRRTPLPKLKEWEPILVYTVVDYGICRKPFLEDGFLVPHNPYLFAGEPFACIIGLGNSSNTLPNFDPTKEVVARIKDVGNDIDLVLNFTKTNYKGQEIRIPNTDIRIWSTHNIIQVMSYTDKIPR
jgi:hypothetical protein